MEKLQTRIQAALDKVRPLLQADGGDVEFVRFDQKSGVLYVRLQGMCAGCPMAQMTIKEGIEKAIVAEVSEVKSVVSA